MDVSNIYDSKRDIAEFDKLEVKLISVIDTVEVLIKQGKELNTLFSKGTPKEYATAMSQLNEVMSRLARTERDLLDLTGRYERLSQSNSRTTRDNSRATGELANQTALLRERRRLLNREARDQAQVEIQQQQLLSTSLGLYNKVQLKLSALTVKYNELAIRKQLGLKLSAAEERSYNNLVAKIQKYDAVLKGVDATVGRYQRNVGNYASGFNPLSNSINQLTREAPAFANSLQTGFMAISNNLPILFDAIGQIRKQNALLKAEGKATVSTLKQIGQAIFSWQTALSLVVTLLTIYGKDIVNWISELVRGKKALDSLTASQQAFTEALKNGDYANAVKTVREMAEYVKLAKDGFIDKERVLKEYNEGLGKVIGTATSFNQIEDLLIAKTPSYLEAMRLRSAAQEALKKASEERAKADFAKYQPEQDFKGIGAKIFDFMSFLPSLSEDDKAEQESIKKAFKKNTEDNRKDVIKTANDNAKAWDKAYDDLEKKAAEVAKKGGLNVTNLFLGGEKQKKDNTLKDALRDLEAIRDTLLAVNEKNFIKGKIDEETYVNKIFDINKAFYNAKLNLIKGKNAEERKMIAQTKLDLEKAEKERDKKLYEIQKKRLDDSKKVMESEIANRMKVVENDPYMMEVERINQQSKLYDELTTRTEIYYASLIQAAKNNNEEILSLEKERDEEITKIRTKQQDLMSNLPDAAKKDLEYYRQIEDLIRETSDIERKTLIISNSKLSNNQKSILLQKENFATNRKTFDIEIKRLETDIARLKAKQLQTIEEKKQLEILEKALAAAKYNKKSNDNEEKDAALRDFKDKLSPTIDFIKTSFNDLGLENLLNSFDRVFDDIWKLFDGTLDKTEAWKTATIAASSAIADALTMVSNTQKEKTIANLDEQLKASQESSEQEIGFINSRLEELNNLENATEEQIKERNRLEDQARGMREQQAMKEKMIAKRKAKAEQRAAAQQAIIAGILGAAKSIPNWIQVALSLAAGAAMAGIIMAKDPTPQYFIGTDNAKEGWAYTQERGAEIITDKSGNIKSWGNNRGSQLTYMNEGDKVLTAFESQAFKKKIRDVSVPDSLFLNYARESVLPSIIIPKQEDNSQKIIEGVGKEFERVFGKYDKPVVIENEDGDLVYYMGSKIPEVRKKKKPKPTTIIIPRPNVRD